MILKILKRVVIALAVLVGATVLFLLCSILPIDRYDYHHAAFYPTMLSRLDSLKGKHQVEGTHSFSVGCAKVNLTPDKPISLAGYGNRKGALYTSVLDSIYVRTLVIDNGVTRVAVVSADLLIIPPTVTELLKHELPIIGFDLEHTYLSATHSHNSIGNWGEGVVGFMYGKYNDSIVHFIVNKIKTSIAIAAANCKPAALNTAHVALGSVVRNRITNDGGIDSLLHVLEIRRSDSTKLVMVSYTAHATCLFSRDLQLSRDYPGKVVDSLEHEGYNFAMFMAGAVGSHGVKTPKDSNCMDWVNDAIISRLHKTRGELRPLKDTTLVMYRIPLMLGKAQVKIDRDWKVRPWLFRAAFGESPNYLTALRVGELVLLGTPCDYSGELTSALYEKAHQEHLQVMVTSFNGGYIGYITPNKYYDVDHYETRLMNWYGPGSGEYMQECLLGTLDIVSH